MTRRIFTVCASILCVGAASYAGPAYGDCETLVQCTQDEVSRQTQSARDEADRQRQAIEEQAAGWVAVIEQEIEQQRQEIEQQRQEIEEQAANAQRDAGELATAAMEVVDQTEGQAHRGVIACLLQGRADELKLTSAGSWDGHGILDCATAVPGDAQSGASPTITPGSGRFSLALQDARGLACVGAPAFRASSTASSVTIDGIMRSVSFSGLTGVPPVHVAASATVISGSWVPGAQWSAQHRALFGVVHAVPVDAVTNPTSTDMSCSLRADYFLNGALVFAL